MACKIAKKIYTEKHKLVVDGIDANGLNQPYHTSMTIYSHGKIEEGQVLHMTSSIYTVKSALRLRRDELYLHHSDKSYAINILQV